MRILVTGGLGYIGSHTIVELSKKYKDITIIDNLINSKITVLDKLINITKLNFEFHKCDITDRNKLESIFKKGSFDSIFHFAGLKAVGESIERPLLYYRNNLQGTINITDFALKYGVKNFIFSSSATVYGDNLSPLNEKMELKHTTNPYGETKAMSERIIIDAAKASKNLRTTLLRYFNPVGAHNSGLIGENPNGIPNNLMPFITKVAKGELKELNIFGNDYNTPDGTGVRDYIHVVDLAKGHVAALKKMKQDINIYNLGTGVGYSVLEVVHSFENENEVTIPFKFVDRRPGDLAVMFADVSKAKQELGWSAKLSLKDMVKDSWRFAK